MAKTGPPGPTGAVIAKWVTSSQVIGVLAAPHAGRLEHRREQRPLVIGQVTWVRHAGHGAAGHRPAIGTHPVGQHTRGAPESSGSYFHHADSLVMMRGGHLPVCALGVIVPRSEQMSTSCVQGRVSRPGCMCVSCACPPCRECLHRLAGRRGRAVAVISPCLLQGHCLDRGAINLRTSWRNHRLARQGSVLVARARRGLVTLCAH